MEESNIVITKPKIKFKNFWIWFKDQVKRKRFFITFLLVEMRGAHFQLILI